MATTNDLKNGMTLNLDGNLMNVVGFQHVKPGKGGAFVRTKLKNVRTGRTLDKTFRADEPVEVAILDKREMQYLYRDETGFHFMDTQTYDQSVVDADAVGDAASWLTDGATPYRPRSSSRWPRPSPASRATGSRARPSRQRSRPGRSSRCRCSWRPATGSRSTPAPGRT
jgi:translation elongation factor P/translation initiation factor 5A